MKNNIILTGMMGCGKTTVGKLLSERLGLVLADTDALIEVREGRSIADIFAQNGEEYFRALELSVSRELGGKQDMVLACGGGLPLQEEAVRALKNSGLVFWLDRDPRETYDCLDVSGRPLAQAGREDFAARYERRAPVYRRWADHIIRAKNPEDAADIAAELYQKEKQ